MRLLQLAYLASGVAAITNPLRNVFYFDQYHVTNLPNKTLTAGITHVITAFANSSLFAENPMGPPYYKPFMDVSAIRGMFDPGVKVSMGIGGWGDTAGFSAGAASEDSRFHFAQNIAATLKSLEYDGVDLDWEYPAKDYTQVDNEGSEADTFGKLLTQIRTAIGPGMLLSIAAPGLERDMGAYTTTTVQAIMQSVDFVNLMTYDLMNRADNVTKHHTDLVHSLQTVHLYESLGMDPTKLNLGFAFYAKWFTTIQSCPQGAAQGLGCPTVLLQYANGTDTGMSGVKTFEFTPPVPSVLTDSTDGSCGATSKNTCAKDVAGPCCSQYDNCGIGPDYCGLGCQSAYSANGSCTSPDISSSWASAQLNRHYDAQNIAYWWWDSARSLFWTWETHEVMVQKFISIVACERLGGVMAWSLGEDSQDWDLIKTIRDKVQALDNSWVSPDCSIPGSGPTWTVSASGTGGPNSATGSISASGTGGPIWPVPASSTGGSNSASGMSAPTWTVSASSTGGPTSTKC